MEEIKLNTIEEALEDIRAGKVIIVVDDEDRENEGDFLTAARNSTPEIINFMATHGRGLICAPLSEDRCTELNLELMVQNNIRHVPIIAGDKLLGLVSITDVIKRLLDKQLTETELMKDFINS